MMKAIKDIYCFYKTSNQILQTQKLYRLKIYTNKNEINGKIGVATIYNQKILRVYIGRADLYTICYSKLYRILMAISLINLFINIEKQYNIIIVKIYTNN